MPLLPKNITRGKIKIKKEEKIKSIHNMTDNTKNDIIPVVVVVVLHFNPKKARF